MEFKHNMIALNLKYNAYFNYKRETIKFEYFGLV